MASRSFVFKVMLYGYMQRSISDGVSFQNIKFTALHAVLSFFLLSKLMQLALDRAHDITDFGVATSLFNDAAASVP